MRHRARPLAAALAVAALCCALVACTGGSSNSDGTYRYSGKTAIGTLIPQAQRKPAADFGGTLLSGGRVDLKMIKAKAVVVNFWASWCGPCQAETPQFDLLYRAMKSKGVTFLGVDYKDVKGNARAFVSENRISFPSIYDELGTIQVKLGNILAPGPPFTALLDQHRRVAAVYLGPQSDIDVRRALTKLLAER